MNPAKRREIFSRLRAANPHPTTELEYGTPFELLVAVVLSAQSTDKGVNLATRKLFPVANTPPPLSRWAKPGWPSTSRPSGFTRARRATSSPPARCWSSCTTARCRPTVPRSRRCPGWAARPPT
jgi:endonuclease III